MSVFISIQSVSLYDNPANDVITRQLQIFLLIESNSAALKTDSIQSTKIPPWKDSWICSTNEQHLKLSIVEEKTMISIGTGQLHFASTGIYSLKNSIIIRNYVATEDELKLKNSIQTIVGYIRLSINYDKTRKYLGEIQFFDLQNKTQQQNEKKEKYFSNKKLVYENNSELQLFKGSCKTKNLFSWLDESVADQKFNWMQQKYR